MNIINIIDRLFLNNIGFTTFVSITFTGNKAIGDNIYQANILLAKRLVLPSNMTLFMEDFEIRHRYSSLNKNIMLFYIYDNIHYFRNEPTVNFPKLNYSNDMGGIIYMQRI